MLERFRDIITIIKLIRNIIICCIDIIKICIDIIKINIIKSDGIWALNIGPSLATLSDLLKLVSEVEKVIYKAEGRDVIIEYHPS